MYLNLKVGTGLDVKIIVIVNQKGDVGQTATCTNLEMGLAMGNKKVLLVDTYPEGSLSISLGYSQLETINTTLATIMGKVITARSKEGILYHYEGADLFTVNVELRIYIITEIDTG